VGFNILPTPCCEQFPPTRSGCPEPHPTWPGTPPGMGHPQLWAAVPAFTLSKELPLNI